LNNINAQSSLREIAGLALAGSPAYEYHWLGPMEERLLDYLAEVHWTNGAKYFQVRKLVHPSKQADDCRETNIHEHSDHRSRAIRTAQVLAFPSLQV
jgi:hypothetical protein